MSVNLSTRSVLKTTVAALVVVCSLWSYTKKKMPDSINNNKKKSSFVYKYIYASYKYTHTYKHTSL